MSILLSTHLLVDQSRKNHRTTLSNEIIIYLRFSTFSQSHSNHCKRHVSLSIPRSIVVTIVSLSRSVNIPSACLSRGHLAWMSRRLVVTSITRDGSHGCCFSNVTPCRRQSTQFITRKNFHAIVTQARNHTILQRSATEASFRQSSHRLFVLSLSRQ